jgi:hypothetical protein
MPEQAQPVREKLHLGRRVVNLNLFSLIAWSSRAFPAARPPHQRSSGPSAGRAQDRPAALPQEPGQAAEDRESGKIRLYRVKDPRSHNIYCTKPLRGTLAALFAGNEDAL